MSRVIKIIFIIVCVAVSLSAMGVFVNKYKSCIDDYYGLPSRNESYKAELKRFEKVLQEASDEELFLMLRLAIYKGYVPTPYNDPFHDVYFGIREWYRTRLIYQALNERNRDFLYHIYPDLNMLDKYVNSAGYRFEKEDKDTTNMGFAEKWNYNRGRKMYPVRETIMQNLAPDSALFESITYYLPGSNIYNKYFDTPLFRKH